MASAMALAGMAIAFMAACPWRLSDAALAQETRHKFYDMAAAEKATVIGFHFTFPSVGHVEKDGARYRLIPSAWNPTI